MIALLYVSLAVFTSYLIIIGVLFGWLPSISQSYYEFSDRWGNKASWAFTIALWGFAIPFMIAGIEMSAGSPYQWLMFLAPAGICFTGAAPQFKKGMEDKVHYIGAVSGIVLGMLGLGLIFHAYYAIIGAVVAIGAMQLLKVNNKTYWIEVIAFYTIILTLILKA